MASGVDTCDRTHAVRVCREKCSEIGFSGRVFHECVKLCVKEIVGPSLS